MDIMKKCARFCLPNKCLCAMPRYKSKSFARYAIDRIEWSPLNIIVYEYVNRISIHELHLSTMWMIRSELRSTIDSKADRGNKQNQIKKSCIILFILQNCEKFILQNCDVSLSNRNENLGR